MRQFPALFYSLVQVVDIHRTRVYLKIRESRQPQQVFMKELPLEIGADPQKVTLVTIKHPGFINR